MAPVSAKTLAGESLALLLAGPRVSDFMETGPNVEERISGLEDLKEYEPDGGPNTSLEDLG